MLLDESLFCFFWGGCVVVCRTQTRFNHAASRKSQPAYDMTPNETFRNERLQRAPPVAVGSNRVKIQRGGQQLFNNTQPVFFKRPLTFLRSLRRRTPSRQRQRKTRCTLP